MTSKYLQPVFAAIMLVLLLPLYSGAASTIDPDNDGSRYAFGENVGWINLAPAGGEGVTVTPSLLTGKAWGENIGWINFSPVNGEVVNDGMGHLSGYAWGENVGWINFAPTGGGVEIDPVTGIFSGSAWGENIGWISFASTGAVPFRVKTSPVSVTGPLNGLCGSANGGVFASAPTAISLCSVGESADFAGYGPWSWTCSGLNGGSEAGCSASVQTWPLNVSREGGGTGTVTSTLPHAEINCGSTCSRAYAVNSVVTLVAAPSTGSRLSGWSGCDTVNGRQCTVTLNGARNVTAEFSADIKVIASFHDTIQAGYGMITAGDIMKLRSTEFTGELVFNRAISFILRGGHDALFSSTAGTSTIHGSLTIAAGSVELDGIVVTNSFPAPGNNGTLTASVPALESVSLQLVTGKSFASENELQYRVYCSDTDTVTTVADMEAYGTPMGAPTFANVQRVAGKVNNALDFSGSDSIDVGNGSALNFGTGSFTVEAWVKPGSWVNAAGIISKGATHSGEPGYTLRQVQFGDDKYFQLVLGNGIQQVYVNNNGYVIGEWYHLLAVADRANNLLKLYVNGVVAATKSIAGFTGSTNVATNLTIGKQYQPLLMQDRYFNGIVDEAAVYSRALSDTEITDRYNAGVGKSVELISDLAAGWNLDEGSGTKVADVSGGGNTGTLHFATPLSVSGISPLTRYSCNVMIIDEFGNRSIYSPVTVDTPILPIGFNGSVIPYNFYMPAVGDLNNDGFIEALGTLNDGNGNLVTASAASMGIGKLFTPGRVHRDCRIADFNGDNLPDIICNTYSAAEDYTNPDPLCQSWKTSYNTNSVALLFLNNGNGTFREDPAFTAKNIMGFGETILVADFNNDSSLDIFIPYYSSCSPNEHSWLLINDGSGNFTEISEAAGVGLRNRNVYLRVEGAQAVDFNLDGWIDFYAAGHLFINNGVRNGVLTFTDQRAALGLPDLFDEGFKFTDWNNDGYLDLVIHHPTTGPALYQFNGATFSLANVIPTFSYKDSYGLNIFDMNNDGREDIISAGGTLTTNPTVVLLNNGSGFERSNPTGVDAWGQDTISFADIDEDGKPDLLKRKYGGVGGSGLAYFKNTTTTSQNSSFKIELLGSAGEKNQQGRVVKIYPQNHPGVIFTRIVDSGSGYMSQSSYDILVGTPYQEPHRVEAYFQGGIVSFTINPGEKMRVYPDGTTQSY